MSLSTVIAAVSALVLFLAAVAFSADNALVFFSLPSFLMVAGGTLAYAFLGYQMRYVILALKAIRQQFRVQKVGRATLPGEIAMFVRWSFIVRRKGLTGLEDQIKKVESGDPFVIFGLELVVTGYPGEEVRRMLTDTVESSHEREQVPVNILRNMAGAAPAFGMIGTLVGLIIMLGNMGGEASRLGPGMAIALVTTLYGVLLARLVLLPAAEKADQKNEIERFRRYLMLEGFVMLAEGATPRYIIDRLNAFVDPAIQYRKKTGRSKSDDQAA